MRQGNHDYIGNSQQDALEFLLPIIGRFEDEDTDVFHLFQVVYSQSCICNTYHFKECYLTLDKLTCVTCRKQKQQTIDAENSGKYIIFLCKRPLNDAEEHITLKSTKGIITYVLMSEIRYSGNGRDGHYTCSRMCEIGILKGQKCNYSDKSVSPDR